MKTVKEITIMRDKIRERIKSKENRITDYYVINQLDERVKTLNWVLELGFIS